jgi:hypothetical protein
MITTKYIKGCPYGAHLNDSYREIGKSTGQGFGGQLLVAVESRLSLPIDTESRARLRRPLDARQSAIATWLLVLGAW